jgi:hypothetical protein
MFSKTIDSFTFVPVNPKGVELDSVKSDNRYQGHIKINYEDSEYTEEVFYMHRNALLSSGYMSCGYTGIKPEIVLEHNSKILTPPLTRNISGEKDDIWASYYSSLDLEIAEGYTVSDVFTGNVSTNAQNFSGLVVEVFLNSASKDAIYYCTSSMDTNMPLAKSMQAEIISAIRSGKIRFAGIGGRATMENNDASVETIMSGYIAECITLVPVPIDLRPKLLAVVKGKKAADPEMYFNALNSLATDKAFNTWLQGLQLGAAFSSGPTGSAPVLGYTGSTASSQLSSSSSLLNASIYTGYGQSYINNSGATGIASTEFSSNWVRSVYSSQDAGSHEL